MLKESPKSDLGSSSKESRNSLLTVQTLFRTGGNSPKDCCAPCNRPFSGSHPTGPNTPFALSSSMFGHIGCFDTCTRPAGSQFHVAIRVTLKRNAVATRVSKDQGALGKRKVSRQNLIQLITVRCGVASEAAGAKPATKPTGALGQIGPQRIRNARMSTKSFVHKIAFPPAPPKVSILKVFYWYFGALSLGGGAGKPNCVDKLSQAFRGHLGFCERNNNR